MEENNDKVSQTGMFLYSGVGGAAMKAPVCSLIGF